MLEVILMRRKHRHRSRSLRTPPSNSMSKLTHVRDPRATVRFVLDEQVGWDDAGHIVLGTIVGFDEDNTMARVRLQDGSIVLWPTFSARMKRVQTPSVDEDYTSPGVQIGFEDTRPGALAREDEGYYASFKKEAPCGEELKTEKYIRRPK